MDFSHRFAPRALARCAMMLACVLVVASCAYSSSSTGASDSPPDSLPFSDQSPAADTSITPDTTTAPVAIPTSTTTTIYRATSCVGSDFSVNYPESWYVGGPRGQSDDCLWLSRGSLAGISSDEFVPEISFAMARHHGDALRAASDFEENDMELIDSYATNINSFPATVFDVVAVESDSSSTAEGVRSRIVVIDLDGEALVATATEGTTGDAGDFDETKVVLEATLTSLFPIR